MILLVDVMLFVAIAVIIILVIIFFITYLFNKKTPIPEGCEELAISVQNCSACGNNSCEHHIDLKKISEEIKNENNEEEK